MPATPGLTLYLKDESTHPTGSLKHRLARSLYLYALSNGWISAETPVIEASSGSTAVSEAYFARLLGLRFIAVMPETTSRRKIAQIEFYGGECHLVAPGRDMSAEARALAARIGGHFMDQFTFAERATDWRGNNNIAESIFDQMRAEPHPMPAWIVVSAGTGGTSATIGRYLNYRRYPTRLCVADPEHSAFYDFFMNPAEKPRPCPPSRIEGIGRPLPEPSFQRHVIDRMIKVPDAAAFAAIHFLERVLNRKCGGSTGTNVHAAFQLMAEMSAAGETGSIVTMICDGGERYLDTYYDQEWLARNEFDIVPHLRQLEKFFSSGRM